MNAFEVLSEDVCRNIEYGRKFITVEFSSTVQKPFVLKRSPGSQRPKSLRFPMVLIVSITSFGCLIAVCAVCLVYAQPYFSQPLKNFATIIVVTCPSFVFSLSNSIRRMKKMSANVK